VRVLEVVKASQACATPKIALGNYVLPPGESPTGWLILENLSSKVMHYAGQYRATNT